jgi:hypothetical protein
VSAALYGMSGDSPISNPDSRHRNANPVAMLRAARFATVFEYRVQPRARTAPRTSAWNATLFRRA